PIGDPLKSILNVAHGTFVPALAAINEHGITVRHIADWSTFNAEQQELLRHFDRWRLVVRKGGNSRPTVEVAHEALFREWKRLQGWLEPERERLELLSSLQRAAAT